MGGQLVQKRKSNWEDIETLIEEVVRLAFRVGRLGPKPVNAKRPGTQRARHGVGTLAFTPEATAPCPTPRPLRALLTNRHFALPCIGRISTPYTSASPYRGHATAVCPPRRGQIELGLRTPQPVERTAGSRSQRNLILRIDDLRGCLHVGPRSVDGGALLQAEGGGD